MRIRGFFLLLCFLMSSPAHSASQPGSEEINNTIPSLGTGTVIVKGEKIKPTAVTYDIKSKYAVFEGDILLGEVENLQPDAQSGIIITGAGYRWPNNIVPYSISGNVDSTTRGYISSGLEHIEARSALTFVLRTSSNASQYPDYIEVISNDYACWSYVGRIGGKQQLNIVSACGFGATVHEFCHALGMWHEQSREDRNSYVTINWANIQSGMEHNFNQHISDGDDIASYDYGSLMHYGRTAFSVNGQDTITPLQSGVTIGQRDGLSATDIVALEHMYGAPAPPPPVTGSVASSQAMYSLLLKDGASSPSCQGDTIRLQLNFDNYPYETSWSIRNSGNAVVASGGPYTDATAGSSTTVYNCLQPGNYTLYMYDNYGDGMCCSHGNGSYYLSNGSGTVLASGSSFGSVVTHSFTVTAP